MSFSLTNESQSGIITYTCHFVCLFVCFALKLQINAKPKPTLPLEALAPAWTLNFFYMYIQFGLNADSAEAIQAAQLMISFLRDNILVLHFKFIYRYNKVFP